jgi:nucleotide-binding universal stress UspA family protein
MQRTIVVGHDGSASSDLALDWALDHAERRRAPVQIVRAFERSMFDSGLGHGHGYAGGEVDDLRARTEADLTATRDRAQAAHPGLEVTSAMEEGVAQLVLVGLSRQADTIVLGSHGAGGFSTLVAGSTTMHVASHAECAVVAVPSTARSPHARGVVVGVDGSEVSEAAIAYAFQEATELGSPLTAVHAWSEPLTGTAVRAAMPLPEDPAAYTRSQQILLAESLAGWSEKYPDVEVHRLVVHGHPVRALADASSGAALLVVGCHGRGAVRSILLGSVSHGVLHLATSPVAVVRGHAG